MAEEKKEQQQPSFMQIVRHPVTYALVVVVSVFWFVLYWVTGSKDTQLEREAKLYQMVIEEVRKQVTPAVDKVNQAATKVDSAAVKVDSVAQQQKQRKGGRK